MLCCYLRFTTPSAVQVGAEYLCIERNETVIKKYSIPAWYFMSLVFTGVLLLPHLAWQGAADYSISFTQFGPLFASLLLLRITKDESVTLVIKSGLCFSAQRIRWYVLSAVIPIALVGVCALVLNTFSSYHAWDCTPLTYTLSFAALFLGSIGEEVGWRGYLLSTLSKKVSPFFSSIITGLLWGFWHLNYAGDLAFWLLFIVTTIELSIVLTFLMNKSCGNLWTAIIMHTLFNAANRMFVWERFNIELLLIEVVVFGLASAAVAIFDRKRMFNKGP